LAAYKVPGFRAQARGEVYEIKDRPALAITLERRQKTVCSGRGTAHHGFYDKRWFRTRDLKVRKTGICPPDRRQTQVHRREKIRSGIAQGKSVARGQAQSQIAFGRQHAAQHRLHFARAVRSTLVVSLGVLGAQVLRYLESPVALAASRILRDVRRYDRASLGRHRRLLQTENKIALGFVEGHNNKIRVIQRRSYGYRDEEYLKLKILTASLPELENPLNLPTGSPEEPKQYDWPY
jgi:hypothetical protein